MENKIVIMLSGAPIKEGEPVLPPDIHKVYSSSAGLDKKFPTLISMRPAAIMIIATDKDVNKWESFRDISQRFQLKYSDNSKTNEKEESYLPDGFTIKPEIVNAIFNNQEYNPLKTEENNLEGYQTFALKNTSIIINYEITEDQIKSSNIVGLVNGTDPNLNKYVVVSAHLDHIPPKDGKICNGADDNASGSSGLLEIAEAIAIDPPRHSVLFTLFTGEEFGHLGSTDSADNPPIPLENIIANINLDEIGRTHKDMESNRGHYVSGFEGGWEDLRDLIKSVNNRSKWWPLHFVEQSEIPASSDHRQFHSSGIPAILFWSGRHEDWHEPTDDANKIEDEESFSEYHNWYMKSLWRSVNSYGFVKPKKHIIHLNIFYIQCIVSKPIVFGTLKFPVCFGIRFWKKQDRELKGRAQKKCAITVLFFCHLMSISGIFCPLLSLCKLHKIVTLKTAIPRRQNTIYRRGILMWAMAGSNCRPLPCEDSVLRRAILEVCYNCATLLFITVHL